MANELQITKTVTYTNGQLRYTYSPGSIMLPQTNRGYSDKTVSVTSVESDVVIDVGSQGYTFLRSLEATSSGKTIVWGTTQGLVFRLPPKACAEFCFATSAGNLAMKTEGAIAGTVKVQVLMFEN